MLGACHHRAGHEEHAWTTPEGTVVDLPVNPLGEITDVRHPDVEQARGAGGPEQTSVKEAGEHLGKKGEDIDAHDKRTRARVVPPQDDSDGKSAGIRLRSGSVTPLQTPANTGT
jgi:hypothetical protein